MGWIDIVVIALVLISAIIGLSKGLFESILSIFGSVLSLFVAIWASKPVAGFLNSLADVNAFFGKLLVDWGVADASGNVKILFKTFTLADASSFVTLIASVILVFILIKLVIWLLSKLFDSATANNSALSGLNRLLGLLFGAAKGLLFVAFGFAIASLVSQVAFGAQIRAEIEKNTISNFVYKYVDDWVEENLEDQLQKLIGNPVEEEEETETPSGEETETPGEGEGEGAGE